MKNPFKNRPIQPTISNSQSLPNGGNTSAGGNPKQTSENSGLPVPTMHFPPGLSQMMNAKNPHMSVMTTATTNTQYSDGSVNPNAMVPFKHVRDSVSTTATLPVPSDPAARNRAINVALKKHQNNPAMVQMQQHGISNKPLEADIHDKVNEEEDAVRKKDKQKLKRVTELEGFIQTAKKRVRVLLLIDVLVMFALVGFLAMTLSA